MQIKLFAILAATVASYVLGSLWYLILGKSWRAAVGCQSAFKSDPVSASNFDPLERRVLRVALVSLELAGIAETRRARVV